ncbi:MAG: FtsW/RodA/SpoVE family cell cycle protein [Clostridia bacterium]|nr:FtsW/RodA/SpoVE family cell cycle protein [Clostridia bacterium]
MNKFIYWFKDIMRGTDKLLLGICLVLSSIGILMVYSATRVNLKENMIISRDARTMIIAVFLGVCIAVVMSLVDYEAVTRLWPIIAVVCLGLMVSLFFFGNSPSGRQDAISWLKFGSFYFQPSELLKIGFIITFSVHLDAVKDEINSLKNVIFLGIHAMIAIGLVILTGDLGSALVFMVMTIGMLFVCGLYLRYFIFGAGAVIAVAPIAWFEFLSDFQKQRFMAIYSPASLTEATYKDVILQQKLCLNAIGSGKIFGQGLFQGTYTQAGTVPESQNDMIFSAIGEELGFVGAVGVLLVLTLLIIKIVCIGQKAVSLTGKLICNAVAVMIATHIVVNVGMCLNVLPCVGITLPFMSAGGSSNLCIYIAIGLVLSVYRSSKVGKPIDYRHGKLYSPFTESY